MDPQDHHKLLGTEVNDDPFFGLGPIAAYNAAQDQFAFDGNQNQFSFGGNQDQFAFDGALNQLAFDDVQNQFVLNGAQDQVATNGVQDQLVFDDIRNQSCKLSPKVNHFVIDPANDFHSVELGDFFDFDDATEGTIQDTIGMPEGAVVASPDANQQSGVTSEPVFNSEAIAQAHQSDGDIDAIFDTTQEHHADTAWLGSLSKDDITSADNTDKNAITQAHQSDGNKDASCETAQEHQDNTASAHSLFEYNSTHIDNANSAPYETHDQNGMATSAETVATGNGVVNQTTIAPNPTAEFDAYFNNDPSFKGQELSTDLFDECFAFEYNAADFDEWMAQNGQQFVSQPQQAPEPHRVQAQVSPVQQTSQQPVHSTQHHVQPQQHHMHEVSPQQQTYQNILQQQTPSQKSTPQKPRQMPTPQQSSPLTAPEVQYPEKDGMMHMGNGIYKLLPMKSIRPTKVPVGPGSAMRNSPAKANTPQTSPKQNRVTPTASSPKTPARNKRRWDDSEPARNSLIKRARMNASPTPSAPATPFMPGPVAKMFSPKVPYDERMAAQQAALNSNAPPVRRTVESLMRSQFHTLHPHEKARLLLPLLQGIHPLAAEREERADDPTYGASRQREALQHLNTGTSAAAQSAQQL
jgi:hypothetical protein